MTKDRAISVDEARALALLGWHHEGGEWTRGDLREGSPDWYKDLKHAEATISATKQLSHALETALNGIGRLGDGRHEVDLQLLQRLSDNEFLVFCTVGDHHDSVIRIQVQGWKP